MPYTYYLYHVPTGKKYYGCQYGNNAHPSNLWTIYFTSSEYVEELIKMYGKESFIAEVRKTFHSGEKARYWEDRVLHRLKAPERDDWLNKAYACGPAYYDWTNRKHRPDSLEKISKNHADVSGEKNPMYHKTHSVEAREKIRQARLGTKHSEEFCESTRARVTGTKWIYNLETKETRRTKEEILPDGYAFGRPNMEWNYKVRKPPSKETRYNMSIAQKKRAEREKQMGIKRKIIERSMKTGRFLSASEKVL